MAEQECNDCPLTKLYGNAVFRHLSAIFRWVDPVESVLVFLVVNFFYLVIVYGDYSVLTLVCTVHCAAIVVCATWAACNLLLSLATKKAKENTLTAKLGSASLEFDSAALAEFITLIASAKLAVARKILFFEDPYFSIKMFHVFFLLAQIGNYLSGITLLYLGALVLFVVPKIYEMKQKEIDSAIGLATTKYTEVRGTVLAKIPPGIRQKLKLD